MKIVFPLTECTFLRYFIPLAKSAIDRNHEVFFALYANSKYNNPLSPDNLKKYIPILNQLNIKEGDSGDVCVCIEGIKSELAPVSYSLTYMYDFSHLYNGYIDRVNHVVFPSSYLAQKFGCISDKNLYLGSPKYDFNLGLLACDGSTHKKYGLDRTKRYALVMYPRSRDMGRIDISTICEKLISEGYTPILKTRGKDPIRPDHKKYINFGDESWVPHTTSELILISEKAMLGKRSAVTNYNIKPSSCVDLPELYEPGSREKYLDPGGAGKASAAIIDHMEKNYG